MKLLTIHRPARLNATDFCHGISGELAAPAAIVCDNNCCGCDRSFLGLASGKSSTTLEVTELDFTEDDAITACIAYLENSGWAQALGSPGEIREVAEMMTRGCASVAEAYEPGTVLRPRYHRETNSWSFEADR